MVDEPEEQDAPVVTPQALPAVITGSTGAIGLAPYGDEAEHTGPPSVVVYTPPFRRFFATDARSVLITLLPQHYNLIPNPAFRTLSGWTSTGITPIPASLRPMWTGSWSRWWTRWPPMSPWRGGGSTTPPQRY